MQASLARRAGMDPCGAGAGGMASASKNMIIGSWIVAGIVALAAILDLALNFPFNGEMKLMDILFLVGAAVIFYMGWDAYRDLR